MNTKKLLLPILAFVLIAKTTACAPEKDLEVEGEKLVSRKPPFTLTLSSNVDLVHYFSREYPEQGSLTRVYFFIKAKEKQVEEMLILQIADKTNPQAGPMEAPPLKPYTEKRSYLNGKMKRGELEVEYLIQCMGWNPDAPSLQPIIKKGFFIPPHWALQGQFLFLYRGENAVFLRYSKDINSFGIKISEKGDDWGKGVISGNEKRVYEAFQETFMQMIASIQNQIHEINTPNIQPFLGLLRQDKTGICSHRRTRSSKRSSERDLISQNWPKIYHFDQKWPYRMVMPSYCNYGGI